MGRTYVLRTPVFPEYFRIVCFTCWVKDLTRYVHCMSVTCMQMLLPLTDFLGAVPSDPLAFVGGSNRAYHMLRDTLSPLHLYAVGAHRNTLFSGSLLPAFVRT